MFEASNDSSNKRRLVVGIDIAKEKHWASIDDGKERPFAFSNDRAGLNVFLDRIEQSKKSLGLSDNDKATVGLEPTGHYWKPLGYALKDQLNIKLVLVNPYHTKLSKELEDNSPLKSDPKDSRLIRNLVREGKILQARLPEGPYANLRRFSRLWSLMNKMRSRLANRLEALLTEYFPEYERCFYDLLGATSLAVLKRYGLGWDIRQARSFALERLILKTSRGKISKERGQELWHLAQNTLGHQRGKEAASFELRFLLEQFRSLEKKQEMLEEAMEKELAICQESQYLLSFPGVSTVSASIFFGATGPLEDFPSYKDLEKMAGLNLVSESSGKGKPEHRAHRRFSKRGREDLRQIVYLITLVAITKNEEFSSLYQEKINNHPGKEKMLLLGSMMAKTLRVLYSLGKNRCCYNGQKLFEAKKEQALKSPGTISDMLGHGNVRKNESLCAV